VGFETEEKLAQELRARVNDLLAAVHLLTPLVQDKGGAQDREHLAYLNKSLYQLIRVIRHMELCSREDDHAFFPQVIDVAGLCRDIGGEVEPMAAELGIAFSWTLDKETLLSLADEELLTMAVLNLLANAFTAAGPGGSVSLRFTAGGGRCAFAVSDSGPGLKHPDADADPFLKTGDGVGLGLAAARRAASLHGGVLVLENGEDRGVRSVLSLPVRAPEQSETVKSPTAAASGGFSTLLVELSPLLPPKEFYPENLE